MLRFASLTCVLSVLCICGCSFETGADGGGTDDGTTGDDTGEETTGARQTVTGSAGSTGASGSGAGTGGSESTSSSTPSTSTTADGPSTNDTSGGSSSEPRSCEELLMTDATAPSGPYLIAGASDRGVTVYCDMDTLDGGWTLVARSVPEGSTGEGFGWQTSRGEISSPDQPYSLDTESVGIEFTEVLVGNRGPGYAWGENVYRLDVPGDFLSNTDNSVPVSSLTTVMGDCNPNGGPAMLRNAGFVGRNDVFWFRDETDFGSLYGLEPDGFNLFYEFTYPCVRGARLTGDSGMIFVR